MDLERGVQVALDGRAILFVGAGFSLGATNINGESFKSGRQLAHFLAAQTGLPPETPLDDAAEEFGHAKGVDALIAELRRQYTATSIADHHIEIARVPWRRIYTTNYDDVLETAHKQLSRKLTPVTTANNLRFTSKTDMVVHLNGYVDHLDRENVWSQFKLTDTSYASSALDSPWVALFRQDLANAGAIFFIGYSIADIDIKRILFETSDLQARTFFVLGDTTDAVTQRRVSRYGAVLSVNAEHFASQLETVRSTYTPPLAPTSLGSSVRQIEAPLTPRSLTDADMLDLLLKSRVEPDLIFTSLRGRGPYFLERKVASDVVALAKQKGSTIVVHSELATERVCFCKA
jgi:hypothetical protein